MLPLGKVWYQTDRVVGGHTSCCTFRFFFLLSFFYTKKSNDQSDGSESFGYCLLSFLLSSKWTARRHSESKEFLAKRTQPQHRTEGKTAVTDPTPNERLKLRVGASRSTTPVLKPGREKEISDNVFHLFTGGRYILQANKRRKA